MRWCGLDDLRTLIRSVSDPAGNADRPPVTRDEPTLGWCEESLDGESVTLESCVARTWWVTQWPDRPVPAGWTRDILQGGRMIALTHIWRPMSMEKSEKDLRDRESSILQRDTLQNQRKLSRDERRERREQRQNVLVLGRFHGIGQQAVALDLPDDRQAVDRAARGARGHGSHIHDGLHGRRLLGRRPLLLVLVRLCRFRHGASLLFSHKVGFAEK